MNNEIFGGSSVNQVDTVSMPISNAAPMEPRDIKPLEPPKETVQVSGQNFYSDDFKKRVQEGYGEAWGKMSWFDQQEAYGYGRWFDLADKGEISTDEFLDGIFNDPEIEKNIKRKTNFLNALKNALSKDVSRLSDDEAQGYYMDLVESDPRFGFDDDTDGSKVFGAEAQYGRGNLSRLLGVYKGTNPNGLFSREAQAWLDSNEAQKIYTAKEAQGIKETVFESFDTDQEILKNHESRLMAKERAVQFATLMGSLSPAGQEIVLASLKADEVDRRTIRYLDEDEREAVLAAFRCAKKDLDANWWLTQGACRAWDTTKSMGKGSWRMLKNMYWATGGSDPTDSRVQERYEKEQLFQLQIEDAERPKYKDNLTFAGEIAAGLIGSAPYMAAMSNPYTGSLAVIGMANDARERMILSGVDARTALGVSLPVGIVEGVIEKLQWEKALGGSISEFALRRASMLGLMKQIVKKDTKYLGGKLLTMGKETAITTVTEDVEEVLQQLTEDLGLAYATGDFKIREIAEDMWDTAVESFPTTFGFGLMRATGAGPAVRRRFSRKSVSQEDFTEYMQSKQAAANVLSKLDAQGRMDDMTPNAQKRPATASEEMSINDATMGKESAQDAGNAADFKEDALKEEIIADFRSRWQKIGTTKGRIDMLVNSGLNAEQAAIVDEFFRLEGDFLKDNPVFRYYDENGMLVNHFEISELPSIMKGVKKVTANEDGSHTLDLQLDKDTVVPVRVEMVDRAELRKGNAEQFEKQVRMNYEANNPGKSWNDLTKDQADFYRGKATPGGFTNITVGDTTLPYDAVIKLAAPKFGKDGGADIEEVGHEIFHAAVRIGKEMGILSEEDIGKMRDVFGEAKAEGYLFNEEDAADAYGKFVVDEATKDMTVGEIFRKIRDFFRRIYNALVNPRGNVPTQLTSDNVFNAIQRGDLRGISALSGIQVNETSETTDNAEDAKKAEETTTANIPGVAEMKAEVTEVPVNELATKNDPDFSADLTENAPIIVNTEPADGIPVVVGGGNVLTGSDAVEAARKSGAEKIKVKRIRAVKTAAKTKTPAFDILHPQESLAKMNPFERNKHLSVGRFCDIHGEAFPLMRYWLDNGHRLIARPSKDSSINDYLELLSNGDRLFLTGIGKGGSKWDELPTLVGSGMEEMSTEDVLRRALAERAKYLEWKDRGGLTPEEEQYAYAHDTFIADGHTEAEWNLKNDLSAPANHPGYPDVTGKTDEEIEEIIKNDLENGLFSIRDTVRLMNDMAENDLVFSRDNKTLFSVRQPVKQKKESDTMFSLSPKNPDGTYNPRGTIRKVRGGWTKNKILGEVKLGSLRGEETAIRLIAEFDSVEELKSHMFYHGSGNSIKGEKLVPSISKSKRWAEAHGGGGFGQNYWGISVSKSKKVASNFGNQSSSGTTIYPIVLAKNAKIVDRPQYGDAAEIEDELIDLWNNGVDAVRIGKWDGEYSEQELLVLNPKAICNIGNGEFYRWYHIGQPDNPINIKSDKEIAAMLDYAKNYDGLPYHPIKPSHFHFVENANGTKDYVKKTDEEYARDVESYDAEMKAFSGSEAETRYYNAVSQRRQMTMFSVRTSPSTPTGRQKDAGVNYPSAADEIRAYPDVTLFSIGKKAREDAINLINKKRPDYGWHEVLAPNRISAEENHKRKTEEVVDEIGKFATPKEQKAALHWFIKGAIRLPEDAPKVTEAIQYGERAKGKANTDPMSYDSPMAMIDALHEFKPKAKPINPDKVPQFSDKREMGYGVVTYLVQDDREGQQAMREIINTHWGEDANPWCLLHGDGHGHLSDGTNGGYDAWHYWNHYNALPKRVAFKDGKLLAFMATDERSKEGSVKFRGLHLDINGLGDFEELMTEDDIAYEDVKSILNEVCGRVYDGGHNVQDAIDRSLDFYEEMGWDQYAEWLEEHRDEFADDNATPPEQWWDRKDASHKGIPLGAMLIPNDPLGRSASCIILRDGSLKADGNVTKTTDTEYLAWDSSGRLEQYDRKDPSSKKTMTSYYFRNDGTLSHASFINTIKSIDGDRDMDIMFDLNLRRDGSVFEALFIGNQIYFSDEGYSLKLGDNFISFKKDGTLEPPNSGDFTPYETNSGTKVDIDRFSGWALGIIRNVEKKIEKAKEEASAIHSLNSAPIQQTLFSVKTLDAMDELVKGNNNTIINNRVYGDINFPLGSFGNVTESGNIRHGLGLLHIVYARMLKEGSSLDEAAEVALRVAESASVGVASRNEKNRMWLDNNGVRAVVAKNKDGNKVITGYEIYAEEPRTTSRANPGPKHLPTPRLEDVLSALGRIIAKRRAEGQSSSKPLTLVPSSGEPLGSVRFDKDPRDVVAGLIAAKTRRGEKMTINEVQSLLSSVGVDPSIGGELLLRGQKAGNRVGNVIKGKFVDDDTFLDLATTESKRSRMLGLLERSGEEGYRLGVEDEQNLAALGKAKEDAVLAALENANGFGALAMELKYGFNIVQSVLNAKHNTTAKKEVQKDLTKPGEVNGPGLTGAEMLAADEAKKQTVTEVDARESAALSSIKKKAAKRADKIDAEYGLNGGESPAQKDAKANLEAGGDESPVDEAGGNGRIDKRRIRREQLDFNRASDFLAFVEEVVAKELGIEKFETPYKVRTLANTAKFFLGRIARQLCYSNARELIMSDISHLADTVSLKAVEASVMNTYTRIQDRLIPEKQDELISKLEYQGRLIAEKGFFFSRGGDERERKVRATVEEWWRMVKSYLRLDSAAVEGERNRLLDIIENRKAVSDAEKASGNPFVIDQDLRYRMAIDCLNALTQYGGLINKTPGEIADKSEEILGQLKGSRAELENAREEDRIQMRLISKRIEKAVFNPKAAKEGKAPNPGWFVRMMDSMIGILEVRMRDLIRYSSGKIRKDAEADLQNIEDAIALGSQTYNVLKVRGQEEFEQIMKQVYGSSDKGVRRLTETLPDEDRKAVAKQSSTDSITRSWLLQRYVELGQTDDYAQNIAINKRDGKWREAFDAVFKKHINSDDLTFLVWMRNWYRKNLTELNEKVLVPVSGIKQYSPSENYFPVKMKQKTRQGTDTKAKAWSPLPSWLTPRVSNDLDFDERTDLLTFWFSRMRESAASIAYAKLGLNLSDILLNPGFKDAIADNHGEVALKRLVEHVTDIVSGGGNALKESDDSIALADKLRAWQTNLTLSANYVSSLKQMTSCPVYALRHDIDFGMVWKFITDVDYGSIKKLMASDGWKSRYGAGFSEALQNAMRVNSGNGTKATNFLHHLYNSGFAVMEFGDSVPCVWVGQGLFRYFVAKIRDTEGGTAKMTEEEIEQKAMTRTWAVIEMTQQSKRTENLTAVQRDGSGMGRFLYQFLSSPVQQLAYEVQAVREALAARGTDHAREANMHLYRVLVVNHILMPNFLYLAAVVAGLPLGKIPEKDSVYWDFFLNTLLGQYGCIFLAGAIAEGTVTGLIKGKFDYRDDGLPVNGIVDLFKQLGVDAHDLLLWNNEEFADDAIRSLKLLGAPMRHAATAVQNWNTKKGIKKRKKNERSWSK